MLSCEHSCPYVAKCGNAIETIHGLQRAMNAVHSGVTRLLEMDDDERGADVEMLGGIRGAAIFYGDPSEGPEAWQDKLPEDQKDEYANVLHAADLAIASTRADVESALLACPQGYPEVEFVYGDKIIEITCASNYERAAGSSILVAGENTQS
jgi:hypothetical protein